MAGSRADSAQDDALIRRYNHQVLVVTAYYDAIKLHEPQFDLQIGVYRILSPVFDGSSPEGGA